MRKSKKNRQPTQWPREKGQKDKQWSTKHTHKTKYNVGFKYINIYILLQ